MYQINYNPARKVWMVWKITGNTAEVVKTFKTEAAAKRFAGKS